MSELKPTLSLSAAAAALRAPEAQAALKGTICDACGAHLELPRVPEGHWWGDGTDCWIDYRFGLVLVDGVMEWRCESCAPHVRLEQIFAPGERPVWQPKTARAKPPGLSGLTVGSAEALELKAKAIKARAKERAKARPKTSRSRRK